MNNVILKCQGIHKSYTQGAGFLHILKGIDLEIKRNEAVCIIGSSGAGKSTLLHVLGTLDSPDRGQVFFKGKNLFAMDEEALALFRSRSLGFVFQFHHLMAEFTALENVSIPARLAGKTPEQANAKAAQLLAKVGLIGRMTHYPNELSGGELQRVAIARALVNDPEIVFADEPTGNLDSKNGLQIQNLFFELMEQLKITLVVVTHDLNFGKRFPRVLRMQDGIWI
jgi:lipoprotein-releasing system ATP-binding protein